MANTNFGNLKAEKWSKILDTFTKANLVSSLICRFDEKANLNNGQTVNRPAMTDPDIGDVGADGSYETTPIDASNEQLTVDQWTSSAVTITDKDKKQLTYEFVGEMIRRQGTLLATNIDRTILSEYGQSSLDAYQAGEISTTNALDTVEELRAQLLDAQCDQSAPWIWVIDPRVSAQISLTKIANSQHQLADNLLINGQNVFKYNFNGINCAVSNGALSWTGEVVLAAQPTNGDTLVIDGVTFTFVSTIGTTAGNVKIGSDAGETRDNLIGLINNPTVTSATQVAIGAFGSDVVKKFTLAKASGRGEQLISAAEDGNNVVITSTKGRITLSETFTSASNKLQNMILHTIFMKKGAIDLVKQKDFTTEIARQTSAGKFGDVIASQILWGKKTFSDGARCMIDAQITTQANT